MSHHAALSILLIEDELADAHLVRLGLQENHIDAILHHVPDGEAALEFLYAAHLRRPDLILLDLNMPRMNGLECLAALKENPALVNIPVVVLTTSAAERDITAARAAGATAFLTKPIDVQQFFATIDSLKRYLR